MSDSEYSETLDVNGQDESEVNRIHMQLLQQREQFLPKEQLQGHNVSYMSYAGSTSSSGESSISSISSDESDEADADDSLELAKINNELFNLPRGLCENVAVFREFFSLETWQDLPQPLKNHLQQFLPSFDHILPPQLASVEQSRTLSMLFNNELGSFGQTPLTVLQQQLEVGNCRPDIIKLRENILKSQRRDLRFQRCELISQMAKQLFISRQRLLDTAYKSAPDTVLKSIPHRPPQPKTAYIFQDNKLSAIRARKRFYNEISQIAEQLGWKDDCLLSADEEDDRDLLTEQMKKDEQLKQNIFEDNGETVKASTTPADRCIYSTNFKKQQNIEDEDAFRSQQKTKQTKLNNRNFKEYLREHKRRKITEPTLPEFETSDIRLRDVCARAQMGGNFKRIFAVGKTPGRKTKPTPNILTTTPNSSAILTTSVTSASTAAIANPALSNIHLTAANTNSNTTATVAQPITITTLPPPQQLPPKLSEPPALVPIQSKLKKPETYQIIKTANKTSQKEFYQTQQQPSFAANSLNNRHNPSESLNISQLMSVGNHADNLSLCMDNSSILSGDHDAFNMLENEVELQQEEVETFGNTCEETIPAFVIGNDVINASSSKSNSRINLMNARNKTSNQHQAIDNISQPLPKLEPISRTPLLNAKTTLSSSMTATATVSELIQETHACYFSLIRDFFCSTPNHRMRYDDLRNKIDVWLRNPITALNEWYSLSDNWSSLLKSAINFLVGEFPDLPDEYVPYIEHKIQLNIYQWIGAGRDSDNRLSELCTLWMEKRKQPHDKQTLVTGLLQNDMKFELCSRSSVENDDSHDDEGSLTPPPPPPRCPTNWTVRAATLEEISEFQRQERERFEQPHKAYTYRMFGYESVVGPVKGIYSPLLALSKARGHSMMVGDRPNFVTILTLVRDAMARLPNGEGTRAEISELLKCSQYINRDASENVLQTIVSGALDRMHTEHDPCVRYDPRRKIWIYLHRNRSEDEFERIHLQNQTIGKANKKLTTRKPKLVTSMGKLTAVGDNDNFAVLANTDTNDSTSSSPITGTLLTMPALVPSNPIIVTNSNVVQRQQQALQQHIINTNKCPPVPPLKYNIPPTQTGQQQQQQKSLLKTTIRTESKASPGSSNLNKQHSFQIPTNKAASHQNSTPIIVATPQGLQTVHVSNATSVIPSQGANQQQHQQQTLSAQQHTNITANLAGKRVTLNKPIIISQVATAPTTTVPLTTSTNAADTSMANLKLNKTPQQLLQKPQLIQSRITLQTNQHQLITQQPQQSNLVIPISMANNMSLNAHQSSNIAETKSSNTVSSTAQVIQPANLNQSATGAISLNSKQNIIRLVPASNVKTLMSSPATNQIVGRHRIITTTATAERPATPQQQQKSQTGGLQLLANNGIPVSVSGSVASQVGSIVKMSPQQFASFQQKQGQQQHIIVKQANITKTPTTIVGSGNKAQRVILGNTAIVSQTGQGKNIVLQQIPAASSSPSSANTPASQTTTTSSPAGALSGVNKIQTINAKNLTPQQQRILIQNLKQQQQQQQSISQNQIQFKTVQVVGNTAGQRTQTVAVASTAQTLTKNLVVVSRDNGSTAQHNITRILKTTSPQLKTEISAAPTVGTRVITSSSGQIISLDSLMQKQGGTLRITGTGNAAQAIKTNQQHHLTTNILQKPQPQVIKQQQQQQQQQTQQFAIVSVPNSIISLNNNSNFTVNQRIITTQAGPSNTTSLVNLDTTKVTPSIVSTGSGRVITATAAGTKIIKQSPANVSAGNIRVINNVNQAANINLASLQGKQVVLASGKTLNTISKAQQQQHQNIVQAQQGGSIVIGGQTIKLQQGNTNIQQLIQKSGNIITSQGSTSNQTTSPTQLQTVIMGNQILRVQQIPQIVPAANRLNVSNAKTISNNINSSMTTTNSSKPKTIFVGSTGQTLRLQPASSQTQTIANKNIIVQPQQQLTTNKSAVSGTTTTPNRVVLAVQGGSQIFLSPNFQGGNINLKSLQNMKVVSLAQHPAIKLKDGATSSTSASAPSTSLSTQKSIFKATSTPTASDTNV